VVLMVSGLLMALAAGAALAIEGTCRPGAYYCEGTNSADIIYDNRGVDRMYGFGGNDDLFAENYGKDHDHVYGGAGSDVIHAEDDGNSGFGDIINGGTGHDRCYVEARDRYSGCEIVY